MKARFVAVLNTLLSEPTAPFLEDRIVAAIRTWAGEVGLAFATDSAGNVIVRYRRGKAKKPRWVFAAHMDHPGFVSLSCRGKTLEAEFRGWVGQSYFKGSRVRFFAPGGEVTGTIRAVKPIEDTPWFNCRIGLDETADVPAGTLGMWDLVPMRIRGQVLSSRAVDDVVGTASVLCAMEEIVRSGVQGDVTALLTRAEEAGFVGALAACQARTLPADSLIVAIETSQAQPRAQLGDGVVIRVGDRARTFDPSLTGHLVAVAERLSGKDKQFKFTRQLMPGGVCESTAYLAWGYCATGLCIPLGNYHNQGKGNRLAAEQINLGDFESLVKLLVGLADDGQGPEQTNKALRQRLENMLKQRARLLKNPI